MNLEELFEIDPYSLRHDEKESVMLEGMSGLTRYHHEHCAEYAKITDMLGSDEWNTTSDIPFQIDG